MDKETLSQYGWIVIVVIIIAILLGIASPMANVVRDSISNKVSFLSNSATEVLKNAGVSEDIENKDESSEYGEAIQMWDISETKGVDNVWMTYYQPKTASYSSRMTTTEVYEGGTVYITGTGNMKAGIYNNFISPEGYVQQVVDWCENKTGYNCRAEYDATITDIDEMANTIKVYIDDESAGDYNGTLFRQGGGIDLDTTDKNLYKFIPTTVIIDEGVTNLSDGAFIATHITEITLPSTITSIGVATFAYCASLTEITIPDSVTTFGECIFSHCTALTSITYKDITYTDADTFNAAVGEMVWADIS